RLGVGRQHHEPARQRALDLLALRLDSHGFPRARGGRGGRPPPRRAPRAAVQGVGIANAVAIATSGDASHSLALLADGTVVAWGNNANSQIGNDTTSTSVPTPVTVCATTGCPTPLSNVVAIATGTAHSVALLGNGTVVAWGRNTSGQLGDTTTLTPRKLPVATSGVANAVAIAAGDRHSAALKADGTVMTWGINNAGQLGDGSSTSNSAHPNPTTVSAAGGATFNLDLAAVEFLPQAGAPIGGTR